MVTPVDQLDPSMTETLVVPPVLVTTVDERRVSGRIHARIAAKLIGLGQTDALSCEAVNVGEGGICVEGSVSLGFSVGKRYEIVLLDDAELGELAAAFSGGVFGTVVRTTMVPGSNGNRVNAGLRFDQPLMFTGFPSIGRA